MSPRFPQLRGVTSARRSCLGRLQLFDPSFMIMDPTRKWMEHGLWIKHGGYLLACAPGSKLLMCCNWMYKRPIEPNDRSLWPQRSVSTAHVCWGGEPQSIEALRIVSSLRLMQFVSSLKKLPLKTHMLGEGDCRVHLR